MSATGTTTSRSHSLVDGGCTTVTGRPPARNRATSSTGRTVADSPTRWAGRSSRASSRSRLSARCAPRLVPATACTSSRMTVSTPASASRALEVSRRNSDSGVVIRTSAGPCGRTPAGRRRGVAGADRDGDVGRLGSPSRAAAWPMPTSGRAQVALDVDGEGLHRRDVEHPAALQRLRRRGRRGQPVERPQERRQRLARAGGGHHEGVVAGADRVPGPGLGGGGRGEGAAEPLRGGGGEPVEDVSCHGRPSLPPPTDSHPQRRTARGGPARRPR